MRVFPIIILVFLIGGFSPGFRGQAFFALNADEPSTEVAEKAELEAEEKSNQWNGAAIRRSIELYAALSERHEKSGDARKAAEMLRRAGRSSLLLEDYETTLAQLKKALALEKSATGGRIESLSLLTLVYVQTGQIEAGEKSLNEGLTLLKSVTDAPVKAEILFSAAELKYAQRKFDESIECAAEAARIWREHQNPKREAEALRTLSFALSGKDDLFAAREKLREALEKSRLAGDRRGEALAQFQMAYFHLIFNEPQKALEICLRSAALFPDDLDYIQKARLYNGIGSIYEIYGDWKSALHYRQKTLDLFRRGNYPSGELATLPSLIDINFRMNDEQSAFRHFQATLEAAALLKDEFYLANAHLFVADFYKRTNSDARAIEHYKTALKYLTQQQYSAGIALINNNLGEIHLRLNENARARAHFVQALEISRRILDNFAQAQTLQNLARLHFVEKNYPEALKAVEESVKITEHLTANTVNSRLKSAFFANVHDRYELYVHLLMQMQREHPDAGYAEQALRAAEKSRARSMLENLALSETDLTEDAAPDIARREKEVRVLLNAKTDKLTDLLSREGEKAEIDKTGDEINELENELENLRAQLKQQSPVYSSIKNPAPFEVADFQQNVLDENTLLLEFSFGTEESYLWLVGKQEVTAYVLPPRGSIEPHIETLRELLKERELKPNESVADFQNRIGEAEALYRREAKELSRKLFGQIAGKLGTKRLVVVPDGKLHYFPVAALPPPDGDSDEPLLMTNEIVYEPSAQTLSVLLKNGRRTISTAKNLLVFSDPVFSLTDARLAENSSSGVALQGSETALAERFRFAESLNNLARLAASKDESETIVQIIGAAGAENYTGFSATRDNLLNLKTGEYKILHFATHGFVHEERPELSGIVLSQYDEKGRQLDKFIRIHDIYGLDLNAELVVLSACETGVGKHVKGEGLVSLNNAFLQTGAKSVMGSLWKVEDGATLELMKNFYAAMANENLTPSEALRRAQIKLRETPKYRSPFYWAAFTMQGDFRSVPQLARPNYGLWLYLLPVLPAAFGSFYFYRRQKAARKAAVLA